MIKVILKQRRANTTLNGKDRQKTGMSTSPTSTPLEVPAGENKQEKETKASILLERNKY